MILPTGTRSCYWLKTGFRTNRRWWGQIEERHGFGYDAYPRTTVRAWTAKGIAKKMADQFRQHGTHSIALHENSRRPRWHAFGPEWHDGIDCPHKAAA